MSCSKWRYTEACDGRPCVGDCDLCSFDPIEEKCRSCKHDNEVSAICPNCVDNEHWEKDDD